MTERVNSKEIFETLTVPRAVKEMALPTIFSQIIVLIYNMADTFYLGRTNNPYMVAGASLILPVFNICLSLAGLTGIGVREEKMRRKRYHRSASIDRLLPRRYFP